MSVKYNKSAFDKVLVSGTKRASWDVAQQIKGDTQNLIPKDHGMLRDLCRVTAYDDGHAEIVWQVKYARRRYYEEAKHYTTPGTGTRWVEKAEQRRGDVWRIVGQKAFAKGMG